MGTAAPPLFRRVARPLPPRDEGAWRRGRTCRILKAALAFMRLRDVRWPMAIFMCVCAGSGNFLFGTLDANPRMSCRGLLLALDLATLAPVRH